MFNRKYCVKCGKPISKDSIFCSSCCTKQEVCDSKFCKQCGKQIGVHATFCPFCGAKQENINEKVVSALSSFSSSVNNVLNIKNNRQIEIPEGYHYCSYCGEVQPNANFERTLGEEFNMCNKCYKRSENIKYFTALFSALIALILIIILLCTGEGEDYILLVYPIPISVLLYKILLYIIKKVLEFTSLRVTLNDKRIKKLRETLDINGNPIVTSVERSDEEIAYYKITKNYLSRDIPYGYYRCPSCEKLHLIKSAKFIGSEDNEIGGGSHWLVGAYYTMATKEYTSMLCPNCYKYKVIDKYIRIAVLLNCLIITFGLYIYIEGVDWGLLGIAFVGGAIGLAISFIVSIIYRLFVYLICRINLFYKYDKAAEYGALMPK